jgi:hypothetical protein
VLSIFMTSKGEDKISKRLGNKRSKVRWNIGRRELNQILTKNTMQGQTTLQEPKMLEIVGQKSWKQPM